MMHATFRRASSPLPRRVAVVLIGIATLLPLTGGVVRAQPQTALQTRPDPDFELGTQKLKEKAYDDAYDAFRRSHRADPTSTRAVVGMVQALTAQDRAEEAVGLLQVEIRKRPGDVDLMVVFGDLLVLLGKYDQALFEFNTALQKLDPGSRAAGDMNLRMGEAYRRKGDDASAIAALKRARDLMPDSTVAIMTLALVLDHLGKRDQAIQAYRDVLKLDAENGVALNNLAYALVETGGNPDEALEVALHASRLLPNAAEVKDTLGWVYLKKKNAELAIATFAPLVESQPANQAFRNHLMLALEQKGETSAAVQELKTLLRANPSVENVARVKELLPGLRQ